MRDDIVPLVDYATYLSGPVPEYLAEVERRTHLRTLAPQMLTGRLQGRLLALFSKLLRPSAVLEIGTFTGYGALCLAEGLVEGGRLHTLEGDPENAALAEEHFSRSPFADVIRLHPGNAIDIIPTLSDTFDLAYLDGDKRGYPDYLDLLVDRIRTGGLLLADNVLWSGKTTSAGSDPVVQGLREFNRRIMEDTRWESVVLPIRDGICVARRV